MKQKITKKQWQELSNIEMLFIVNYFKGRLFDNGYLFNIGQMIEFLGDDFDSIQLSTCYTVVLEDTKKFNINSFRDKELCDALWGAVKFKINI